MNKKYNPKVSIVIPVYNGSNYMREAIDSAINQTYKNIEIIVVNDGSQDEGRTREIALSYGEKILYLEKENGGSSSALNYGIKAMTGEWFSWLSHDDLYYPQKIEKQIDYIANASIPSSEYKRVAVFCGGDNIDANRNVQSVEKNLKDKEEYVKTHGSEYLIAQTPDYFFTGCLINRKLIESVNGFDERLRLVNDLDLWFRIYANENIILFVPEVLASNRRHPQQVSRKTVYYHNTEEERLFWRRVLDWLLANYSSRIELFLMFMPRAIQRLQYETANLARDHIISLYPKIRLKVMLSYEFHVIKSKIRMFIKKIYINLIMDRK